LRGSKPQFSRNLSTSGGSVHALAVAACASVLSSNAMGSGVGLASTTDGASFEIGLFRPQFAQNNMHNAIIKTRRDARIRNGYDVASD
jgi:hypothetical protein